MKSHYLAFTEMFAIPAAFSEKIKNEKELKKQELEKTQRAELNRKKQEEEKIRQMKEQPAKEKAQREELARIQEAEKNRKEEEIKRPQEIEKAWRENLIREDKAYQDAKLAENAKLLAPTLSLIKETSVGLTQKNCERKFFSHPESKDILQFLEKNSPQQPTQQELYRYLGVKSF